MTRAYDYNKRWRQANPAARHAAKTKNYRQTQGGPNTKKEWTSTEIDRILADDRPIDRELAEELGRSVQAIQIKRGRVLHDREEDS